MPAGIKIFADTSTFTDDLEGKLKTAKNRDAYIARTYTINGRLKTDTSKIAVYDRVETPTSTPYNSHVYAFSFTYDRNGRRKTRTDSPSLGGGLQTLVYHPQLGALASLKDRASGVGDPTHAASLVYDARGRLTSRTTGVGTVTESWSYDDDDRVTTRLDEVIGEVYSYDGRGKRDTVAITAAWLAALWASCGRHFAAPGRSRTRGPTHPPSICLSRVCWPSRPGVRARRLCRCSMRRLAISPWRA